MSLEINPKHTALLVMDYQNGIVGRLPEKDQGPLVDRTAKLLEAARSAGAFVGYVVVAFRPGHPEVSEMNASFAQVRAAGMLVLGSPETTVDARLAPRENEPTVVKHRVGPFLGTDLDMILRSRQVDTIVLAGISTSGVVLSTVRYAADSDYRIIVAEDGCADFDADVHNLLMQKVFPRQATITSCEAIIAALSTGAASHS